MEIKNYAASTNTRMTNEVASIEADRSKLSVDDFLKIMVAEMQNQSPFDGGDGGGGGGNTGYMTQLAQFSTLETLTDITDNLNVLSMMTQQQHTFSLIGKEVTLLEEGIESTGIVDKVKFQDGYAVIQVGDRTYNLGSIIEVSNGNVTNNTQGEGPNNGEDPNQDQTTEDNPIEDID